MSNEIQAPEIKDVKSGMTTSSDILEFKFVENSIYWEVKTRSFLNDWIGIYTSSANDDKDYIAWSYLPLKKGSFRTDAMDNKINMEARYFTYDKVTKEYVCIRRTPSLDTKIYQSFAEEEFFNKPSTGICFSGGGSRAMVLAMGQLRGIEQLGLMKNVKYISSVSGGSWASTAYAYRIQDNTKSLIGEYVEPKDISIQSLESGTPPTMASVNTTINFAPFFKQLKLDGKVSFSSASPFTLNYINSLYQIYQEKIAKSQGWQNAIANSFLHPFKLLDNFDTDHFTFNDNTKNDFEKRNPFFKNQNNKVFTQNSNSPYLIVNGVITNIAGEKIKGEKNYIGLEFTPLYTDTGYKANNFTVPFGDKSIQIGNGAIESLAFGGEANSHIKDDFINTRQPFAPLGLGAITGVSSNFLGGIISTELKALVSLIKMIKDIAVFCNVEVVINFLQDIVDYLIDKEEFPLIKITKAFVNFIISLEVDELILQNPETCYWSPNSTPDSTPKSATFELADGGCMDNYGIMPMLRRKVQRVVVFINTDLALSMESLTDFSRVNSKFMDLNLPSLFGCLEDAQSIATTAGIDVSHNHVFNAQGNNTDGLKEVILNLQKAKNNNETVMTTTKHSVIENEWWGIEPYDVEVCWVYNDVVPNFEKELPKETQEQFNLGAFRNKEKPNHFPLYPTVDCTMFGFLREDAAILGHIGAWNVASQNSKKAFESILKA